VFLTVALIVTLVLLLFGRDITRSAHGAISPRRSEDRSFGQLANLLISQENAFDAQCTSLLTSGQSLTRPVFAAQLSQLSAQLALWTVEASQLRRPVLAHNVNDVVAQVTEQRVDDYQSILAAVARSLTLPWTDQAPAGLGAVAAQASLTSTSRRWDRADRSLVGEPGHVTLAATMNGTALLDLSSIVHSLQESPTLALARGVGITAISVSPAALPAPPGELLMPPSSSIDLGVSVSNASYVDQPVTLIVTLVPTSGHGPSQSQSMQTVLGPLKSFAFEPKALATIASEKATLRITLKGAPAAAALTRVRTFRVVMSPSGNG
jgi:hypothetical protein